MATRSQERQRVLHLFREQTNQTEVEMREVVEFAVQRLGWPLPKPIDPFDQLVAEFSQSAREEIRHDKKTGRPYRANHAVPFMQVGGHLLWRWIDIDENPPRKHMHKSLQHRREQMVGDAFQLSLDCDHWNSINPNEEPIQLEWDFTDDVEWRKNGPGERSA